MTLLNIILAPNSVFKEKAKPVEKIDENIKQIINDMLETMYHEHAVGIGANMVAVPWQIMVLDLKENGINKPYVMINPQILEYSQDLCEYEEASVSFPGISAKIMRPTAIKIKYLDQEAQEQVLQADGFLSRVIQHEMDYLRGVVFLDYLSKLKRDMLLKKMTKFLKHYEPHVHGAHCNH